MMNVLVFNEVFVTSLVDVYYYYLLLLHWSIKTNKSRYAQQPVSIEQCN